MGSCFSQKGKGKRIVISEIEPINVLQVAEMMGKFGFSTTKIPVNSEGFINLEKLKETVDNETALVSISAVNNELGTIQPIKEAVDIVKAKSPKAKKAVAGEAGIATAFGLVLTTLRGHAGADMPARTSPTATTRTG